MTTPLWLVLIGASAIAGWALGYHLGWAMRSEQEAIYREVGGSPLVFNGDSPMSVLDQMLEEPSSAALQSKGTTMKGWIDR